MLYAETTEHRTLDPAGGLSTIVISVAPVCSADCMELGTTNNFADFYQFVFFVGCLLVSLYLYHCSVGTILLQPKMAFLVMDTKVMPQLCVCIFFNVNLCIIMLIGVVF